MRPQDFFRTLLRLWPVVVALAVIGAMLGWVATPGEAATSDEQTIYEATNVSFLVANAPSGLAPAQIAYLTTFDVVPQMVAERLGGSARQLAAQVQADEDSELGILEIKATSATADEAELIADTFAEELAVYLTERAVDEQARERDEVLQRVDDLEKQIRQLDGQIATAGPTNADIIRTERDSAINQLRVERERLQDLTAAESPSSGIRPGRSARAVALQGPGVLEEALRQLGLSEEDLPAPGSQAATRAEADAAEARRALLATTAQDEAPHPAVYAGVGGVAGLVMGLALIALLTHFDNRIRTKSDVEDAFGLPVLVEIPLIGRKHRDELQLVAAPGGEAAESYRSLRTSLSRPRLDPNAGPIPDDTAERNVEVLMVVGPRLGDGASTIAANLAVAFAEAGLSVLVVDCDFRQPRIGNLLEATSARSLDGATTAELDEVDAFATDTGVAGVKIARSVRDGEAPELLPSPMATAQRRFVQAARGRYDVIVLDTAPLLTANDASDLLPVADAVLFASRLDHTAVPAAIAAVEQFERLAAPMAGVVLLGSSSSPKRQQPRVTFHSRPMVQENGRSRTAALER